MAVAFTGGTNGSDHITLADAAKLTLPNGPWSIVGRMQRTVPQANGSPYVISYGDYNAVDSLNVYNTDFNGKLRILWRTGTEIVVADSVIVDQDIRSLGWFHFALVFDGTDLKSYVDGSLEITSTISNAPTDTTDATTNSGRLVINNRSDYGTGRASEAEYAEWAKWDRALSAGEIAALNAGYSPRHFPKDMKWHIPLVREVRDIMDTTAVTANNPVLVEHPRIIYPSAQILQFPSAAAPPSGTNPVNPLGHPIKGALGGPIG